MLLDNHVFIMSTNSHKCILKIPFPLEAMSPLPLFLDLVIRIGVAFCDSVFCNLYSVFSVSGLLIFLLLYLKCKHILHLSATVFKKYQKLFLNLKNI